MILENFNPVIPAEEDGFAVDSPTLNHVQKSGLLLRHLEVFGSTIQRKFNYTVVLDLNSRSGLVRLPEGNISFGPPVYALEAKPSFSKYIFCSDVPDSAAALKVRVNKYYRGRNTVVLHTNQNMIWNQVVNYIPESTGKHKVAVVCLLDLIDLSLNFETICMLADMKVNFIVSLSPDHLLEMDATSIIDDERERLNDFLGISWSEVNGGSKVRDNQSFFRMLVKTFHHKMRALGYISNGSFIDSNEPLSPVPFFFSGYYFHAAETKVPKDIMEKWVPQANLFG